MRFFLALLFAIFLSSCSNYLQQNLHPSVLEEKKIQATRKAEIINDNKVEILFLATYLNEIENSFYQNLEYFFVEIYTPNHEPINLKRIHFQLTTNNANNNSIDSDNSIIDSAIAGTNASTKPFLEPLYIRQIKPNEYDSVLSPTNKWSSCYLVAFQKTNIIDTEKIGLNIIYDETPLKFDFSIKKIPFQIF
ncbi:hypothetical protein [Helicobacter fennelliae]|uniref:Putative lipoprotein n=1 Tax=Helicobacter fennelliae TaxID=215 RepID=A0A2X3BDG0_9HELI|nr:hypothetical protein [Helicobacter fennelliae]SQB98653.1 putative lipoprotein [Helicobacter fennelliae]STP07994.1 putative lipoprotein [Helicobacter fennelliae]STQ84097.1 putative lipoprotein [Helicobacter fennelliae]